MICKSCNQPYSGDRCECGQRQEAPRQKSQTIIDELAAALTRWSLSGQSPRAIPAELTTHGTTAHAAAARWLALQEPRKGGESIYEVPICGGQGSMRRCDPFRDRVFSTLHAFLGLSEFDRGIIAAGVAEDRVWWRGESVEQYARIVEEAMEQRRLGPADYRAKVRLAARGAIKKITDSKPVHDVA